MELTYSLPSLPLKGENCVSRGNCSALVLHDTFYISFSTCCSLGYKVFSIIGSVILRITHLGPKNFSRRKRNKIGNTSLGVLNSPQARAAAAMAWVALATRGQGSLAH